MNLRLHNDKKQKPQSQEAVLEHDFSLEGGHGTVYVHAYGADLEEAKASLNQLISHLTEALQNFDVEKASVLYER
jgi:hypothetical protein